MTPKHQEIIDTTLQAIQVRERLYHRVLSLSPEEPFHRRSIEQLRASLLGQKLCWIPVETLKALIALYEERENLQGEQR